MKIIILTLFLAAFYAADASAEDYVNFVGEDREFKCEGANGRWLLPNTTEITGSSEKYTLKKDTNESKLVVKKINLDDVGVYRCNSVIGEKAAKATDKVFSLKTYFPQTITQNFKTEVVNEHGEIVFRCKSVGAPGAVFDWWFGDQKLYESENVKISGETLNLTNIKLDQAGEYTCIAEQLLKTNRNIQERSFKLVVASPRDNYQKPTEHVAKENQTDELPCYIKTVANITFQWFFNGEPVVDESGKNVTNSSLILRDVQRNAAGNYTCQIVGKTQKREIDLQVEYAPLLKTSSPTKVEGSIGTNVSMTCAVEAFPYPQFRWFQNGFEVFDNIETFNLLSRLRVELQSKDSFKDYTCVVDNGVGQIQTKMEFNLVESENNGSDIKTLSTFAFIISAFILIM